jgi:hypothetical protein
VRQAASLRKLALFSLVVAITTGGLSLWLVATGRLTSPILAGVSTGALLLGLMFEWMARAADRRETRARIEE